MTQASATSQWRSILDRSSPRRGIRQPDFTPIETLLCFGLGLIGNRSPAGNVNIRESDPSAIALADLFRRSPGSLALKLANLDGRRAHTAKNEGLLWIELTHDLVRFESLYEIILDAARSIGLDQSQLPDFLGLESNTLQAFLEADRVSNEELRESIDEDLDEWRSENPDDDFIRTEKALLGTARVGQAQFARRVLSNCNFVCVFCGLGFRSAGLPSSRMLIASHIKPWRHSLNSERVDSSNGLAACPTHDAAFDSFLITLNPALEIVASSELLLAILHDAVVARNFSNLGMSNKLILDDCAKPPSESYVQWHFQESRRRANLEF